MHAGAAEPEPGARRSGRTPRRPSLRSTVKALVVGVCASLVVTLMGAMARTSQADPSSSTDVATTSTAAASAATTPSTRQTPTVTTPSTPSTGRSHAS
jgi:predicted benzoate:H+ symporter BenE